MSSRLPLWLKGSFTLWALIWAPIYFWQYGPENYFWLCNLANFLILIGMWRESPLILSSQLLAVLIIGIFWTLDVVTSFAFGLPTLLGTDYMLNPETPLGLRLMSFFHTGLPLITGYAVWRLGYDPRGLWLQLGITAVLFPAARLFTDPERQINFAHPPAEQLQALPVAVYLTLLVLTAMVLLYLPGHYLAKRFWPQKKRL